MMKMLMDKMLQTNYKNAKVFYFSALYPAQKFYDFKHGVRLNGKRTHWIKVFHLLFVVCSCAVLGFGWNLINMNSS